jgi:peroxiredoxin
LKVFAIGVKENGEQASSWSFQHRLTYSMIIDPEGEIYKKFGTGSVPYHVIIDRDFRIRLSKEDFKKGLLIGMIRNTLEGTNPSLRRRISAKLLGGLFTLIRKTRS